jgi:hypothetical protein
MWTFLDTSEPDPRPQICHGADQLAPIVRRGSGRPPRELVELVPYGDRILVVTRLAIGDGSVIGEAVHVVTVHDGRITALRACRSRDEALQVATA